VVERVAEALNERSKAIRGARVLILGVAYKKDVDDTRGAPALALMTILGQRGAELSFSDPYVPKLQRMREYDFSHLESVPLTAETLQGQDVVLIATDHGNIDYQWVVDHSALVVDTRNATRNVVNGRDRIVRA
jgi:UDP-N-acetyl-D-glucosamine dehydrogenase